MKKFVVGLIAGALLMFSAQVYSGSSNLVGTKVAGTMDVNLNKKAMGQAVIIEGKSYLPVRSVAEGMNLKVDVQDKTINLNGLSAEENAKIAQEEQERLNQEVKKKNLISDKKIEIDILKENIGGTKYMLADVEKEIAQLIENMGQTAANNSPIYKDAVDRKSLFEQRLVEFDEKLKVLESELAELEK